LSDQQFKATGLMYYTVETAFGTQSKKMIRLK